MKTWLRVTAFLMAAFVLMVLVGVAFHLLNAASDVAVAAGAGLLTAIVAFLVTLGLRVWKKTWNSGHLSVLLGGLVLAGSGCWTTVGPGHAGIRVSQSGSDRGVQDFPIQTGRVFYNPITESVLSYPTFVQRAIWTKNPNEGHPANEEISYNSKDELVFEGDFAVSYELARDEVPKFYVKFRNDDIDQFTHGFFRDQVRDSLNEAAVQYTADELYGSKKSEFLAKALEGLKARVLPFGVHIISLGYASAPRPPAQVSSAINAKIGAIQLATQKENELRQAEADAKKVVAAADGEAKKSIALAEGMARANELVARSITTQIIQWRQLEIQQDAVRKWNGTLTQYNGGSGPLPFLSVGK